MGIKELWVNGTTENWGKALAIYRLKVMDEDWNFENKYTIDDVQKMDAGAYYSFLKDYFKWKYKRNYFSNRLKDLSVYETEEGKTRLEQIRQKLIRYSALNDTGSVLSAAKEIKGLGVAGASGLLAILFPDRYGTVDKFAIMALKEIGVFPELPDIEGEVRDMDPDNIRDRDAVTVERLFQAKAKALNAKFGITEWTPKKIDMVLWAYREEQKAGWSMIVFGEQ